MGDELKNFVGSLAGAHGDNLKSVVLYGSSVVGGLVDDDAPKKVLVVLDRITPADLRAAHSLAEDWRAEGNPLPVYFTNEEMEDAADVFPIEFIDMSQVRHVLYGKDPFEALDIGTRNLRHQLEYELRGKLLRLRRLYMTTSHNPTRHAELMANSLDSFAVLFRHVLAMLDRAIDAVRPVGAINGISISLVNRAPGVMVRADGFRIVQVIHNLLSNAVKFSPPQGEIEVIASRTRASARVLVVDHGPGVPESFKVLMKEMQALCINVEVLGDDGREIEMRDLDDEVFRAAEELGIDISRPERGSDDDDRDRQRVTR